MYLKKMLAVILGLVFISISSFSEEVKHSSGNGLVVYKVEMDADEVIQLLKANLDAQQTQMLWFSLHGLYLFISMKMMITHI